MQKIISEIGYVREQSQLGFRFGSLLPTFTTESYWFQAFF